MDRKTLAAIILCIAFMLLYRPLLKLAGWDHYLQPPRPVAVDTTRTDSTRATLPPPLLGGATGPNSAPAIGPPPAGGASARSGSLFGGMPSETSLEREVVLETPLYRATFSARGARLVSMELMQFAAAYGSSARPGKPVQVAVGKPVPPGDHVVLAGGPLFQVDLGADGSLRSLAGETFAAQESLDAAGRKVAVTFTARSAAGAVVRQTYRTRPDSYAMDLEVEVRGLPAEWGIQDYSLGTRSWALLTEADLDQDLRAVRATSLVGTNIHRVPASSVVTSTKRFDGNARWAAVQTRYFTTAVAVANGAPRGAVSSGERRPLTPSEAELLGRDPARAHMDYAHNTLVMGLPSELTPQHFVLYAGPSEYFRLHALGVGLERLVDLGWSWVHPFSRWLLQLLKWLYGVFHNYGVSIIVLATLVRAVLHPLNMSSMKNMRVMQKLQPQLERIKEKYKNDPQALNTAMMALYKDNKANPVGGCLPMVLQIPLFIALYQVLFNAIELRQAPFVGWISDLSAPEALFHVPLPVIGAFSIRLLPLLMLGAGMLQQRLTPTDPRQLPTMYLMNVFMLVFFYNLPSGLVLYWTLMNVLTALQQWMVLRQDGGSTAEVLPDPVPTRGARGKRQVTPPATAK